MATSVTLAQLVAGANSSYPARMKHFGNRERQLAAMVKAYVDAQVAAGNELEDDPSPSLAADLDVAGNAIVSNSNGDVELAPNGTGVVAVTGGMTVSGDAVLTGLEINDTSADHQYVLDVEELDDDRTVALPLLTGDDEFTFNEHTQTLTNKSIDSDNNTITNIANADIKSDAAIASSKLAAFDHSTAGLNKVPKMAIVKYNSTADGTISAASEFSSGVTLPDNAIITGVTEYMAADSASSGGTVQLLVGTGGTAITAANTADGSAEVVISATGLGTMTDGATELFVAVASEDLDDGDLMYFVEYVEAV